MDLAPVKLLLAAAIGLAGWIGAVAPLRRGPAARTGRWLSLGNAFAAGSFLGIGLIHLLAESAADWRALGWDYPVAFSLAAVAYLAVLCIEHVVLSEQAHAVVHAKAGEAIEALAWEEGESPLVPYALVGALSIHSLIAGVALGAEPTGAGAGLLFAAIMAHKSMAGFALGVSLARNRVPRGRSRGLALAFAAMTPVGIFAGLGVSGLLEGVGGRTTVAVFNAVAAGTFVYIASQEILRDEFLRPGGRWARWLCTAAGLGVMCVLALWV